MTDEREAILDLSGAADDPIGEPVERRELRSAVRALVARESPPERVREMDARAKFDHELYARLRDLGAMALGAPEAVGGVGELQDQLVLIEELAAGPTSMAAFMIAQFAVAQVLAAHGDGALQRSVLDELLAGTTRVSFSMSEPDGGTDVGRALKTRAEPRPDGWMVRGHKMWTSGAADAQWLIVAARTREPERSSVDGVSLFLVPTDAVGVEIAEIETLGIRGLSTCHVFLDDVAVGADALIGTVHEGMRQAFAAITREGLHACAACLGVGRAALADAVEYARGRQAFGKSIGAFQVPQHWLVDAATSLEAARSLMGRAAAVEAGGGRADTLAQMAKLVASEAAVDVCLRGMQLMGGMGFTADAAMTRRFRDARLWSFSPLNNEMVRNTIGERYLGLPRSY